jgi:hypothetical protein
MDREEIVKSIQKLKLEKDDIIWVTFVQDGLLDMDHLVADFSEALREHGLDNIAVFVPESLPLKSLPAKDAIKELDKMIEGLREMKEELMQEGKEA